MLTSLMTGHCFGNHFRYFDNNPATHISQNRIKKVPRLGIPFLECLNYVFHLEHKASIYVSNMICSQINYLIIFRSTHHFILFLLDLFFKIITEQPKEIRRISDSLEVVGHLWRLSLESYDVTILPFFLSDSGFNDVNCLKLR